MTKSLLRGPSQEAIAMAERLARANPAETLSVAAMRQALDMEFAPRSERASRRFEVIQTHEMIGDIRCLTLMPSVITSKTVILYFFGGGYVSGAPEYELPIAAHLCAATGMKVVLPEYPLAPESVAPAALEAALAVYQALALRHPVLLSGESAGGGLALCLLPLVQRAPRALCLFSPWVDLTEAGHQKALDTDPTLSPAHLRLCAKTYAPDNAFETVSPACFALPDLPPTLISTGTRDIMLPMLRDFATRPSARLEVWAGLWHVFELYEELPEAAQSLDMAALFLTEHASP